MSDVAASVSVGKTCSDVLDHAPASGSLEGEPFVVFGEMGSSIYVDCDVSTV